MGTFSYFTFVFIFFILKSEVKCSSMICDFNSDDCAWYSFDTSIFTWEWTGVRSDSSHGGYLQIPTKAKGDLDQWISTSELTQINTSVHNLWLIPKSGCFTFSYRFYATTDSELSLVLEEGFGSEVLLWGIKGGNSIDWSKASVYIDNLNSEFRLYFTASIALKNSFALQGDWIVSLDDFTFTDDNCLDLTQKVNVKLDDASSEMKSDNGETVYASYPLDIEGLVCFSFNYFYTITNSESVDNLLIILETMSSDGERVAEPRNIQTIEKIALKRESALNKNHFERTIVVGEKSLYTVSLAYDEKVHSSVVLVDNVSFKMEPCGNESPKPETVSPVTETPPPTTTECCVTEPCICVRSTPEVSTLKLSEEIAFETPFTTATVLASTAMIDQGMSSTPITENTFSEANTVPTTEGLSKLDELLTSASFPYKQTTVYAQTYESFKQEISTTVTPSSQTNGTARIDQEMHSTPIFQTEHTFYEASTSQSSDSLSTQDQSTISTALSSEETAVHSQTNKTPLDEETTSRSSLQSTSITYITSKATDPSLEQKQTTESTELVITTTEHKDESSTNIDSTTSFQSIETTSSTTKDPQPLVDIRPTEQNNRTNTSDRINFANLGMNLFTIAKFLFGERSFIASVSGIAGLTILMICILILTLNWKKQSVVRQRELVVSTANGAYELDAYTFRRRTITLSRLEDMANPKSSFKLTKGEDV